MPGSHIFTKLGVHVGVQFNTFAWSMGWMHNTDSEHATCPTQIRSDKCSHTRKPVSKQCGAKSTPITEGYGQSSDAVGSMQHYFYDTPWFGTAMSEHM